MIRRLSCPICKKDLPIEIDGNSAVFPFCSKNCKLVDLNRWLTGEYLVAEQLEPEQLAEYLSEEEPPPDQQF